MDLGALGKETASLLPLLFKGFPPLPRSLAPAVLPFLFLGEDFKKG
jgi:hypothetical protein